MLKYFPNKSVLFNFIKYGGLVSSSQFVPINSWVSKNNSYTICSPNFNISYQKQQRLPQVHTAKLYSSKGLILGIETSCDDTGAAIVDSKGNVVGEALHSQLQTHLE